MSTLAVNTIVDANSGNTAQINGMTPTADSLQGFRNRILNGGMVIDQRNAGASVSFTANEGYATDRFFIGVNNGGGTVSAQRSTTAPEGFVNSLLLTVTATDTSLGASDLYELGQRIEGFNVADLGWGTANAKSVTLSFQVRSSVVGTYSIGFTNSDSTRSYVATYVINAADTFETKTITVPGDTAGTWGTTNGTGLQLRWCLGTGTNRVASAANTWEGANRIAISATANPIMGTSGATFYITGVQLEAGSVATPFERRPFGTELALCQRYYQKSFPQATAPVNNSGFAYIQTTLKYGSANAEPQVQIVFPVAMRAAPSATLYNPFTGTAAQWTDGISVSANARALNLSEFGMQIDNTDVVLNWNSAASIAYAVAAEL
jgi:hypothetical protein